MCRRPLHPVPARRFPIRFDASPVEQSFERTAPPAFRTLSTYASALFGFGFGGAKVLELDQLPGNGNPGDVVFFGVDTELNRKFGRDNPGAAAFIRKHTACMMPWAQAHGTRCHDVGLIASDDSTEATSEAFGLSEHLAGLGFRPVLIGCDHTASMVNVLGATQGNRRPPVYLFLDAHLDLGLHRGSDDIHNGNFVDFLRHSEQILRVVNVGGRSCSTSAPVYQDMTPEFQWIPGGVHRPSVSEMIERLEPLRSSPVYVSLDADVLDPAHAPNVSCPEPFGMVPEELFALCEWIGASCEVLGGDLCELVPTHQSLGVEQILMRCLHALFPMREGRFAPLP